MTEYKRNHTIPRSMLEYWIDPATRHQGVHVYDIRTRRRYVSTGRGGNGFSFAIENDLHIPVVNGKRAVALERWFGALEGPLSAFVRQAHARKMPITFDSPDKHTRTLMALISLECRSRYDLHLIQRELDRDRALLQVLASGTNTPPKKLTLENLIHVVSEQVASVRPAKLAIFHAPRGRSWIMCDRPCVTKKQEGFRTVVLTNRALLTYGPSESGSDLCAHFDATEDMVDLVNREVALCARDWLVADSAHTLEQYVPLTDTEEWQQRVAMDHITSMPIMYLTSGWAISS